MQKVYILGWLTLDLVSTGDAQKPAEMLISKTTTPWTAWGSDSANAEAAPGSGTKPIDIFRVPRKNLNLFTLLKMNGPTKWNPL